MVINCFDNFYLFIYLSLVNQKCFPLKGNPLTKNYANVNINMRIFQRILKLIKEAFEEKESGHLI